MEISDISASFSLLTSLIPEKFYVLEEIEKINKFVKNKQEKAPKLEVKLKSKKAKKSMDLLGNGLVDKNDQDNNLSVKEKLALKISELRQKRKTYSKQELIERRKQKPKQKTKKKSTPEMKGIPSQTPVDKPKAEEPTQMFNIDFGEKKKVKHIDSKALLLKAEQSTKKLEDLKAKDPEKYEQVTASSKMNKMIKQAEGQVVKTDLKLLKKTVKKKENLKKKKAQEWKKREEALEKDMAMRQKKRNQNIQEKKIDKKKRPGF